MDIENATYVVNENNENSSITAVIDGKTCFVPIQVGNRHYDEIMRQVNAGTLTIADAG
jgi:hypothetical protein